MDCGDYGVSGGALILTDIPLRGECWQWRKARKEGRDEGKEKEEERRGKEKKEGREERRERGKEEGREEAGARWVWG